MLFFIMPKLINIKNFLSILLLISTFVYIRNAELKGIFRIDSVSNGNSLTDENYRLQFDKIKEKINFDLYNLLNVSFDISINYINIK